MSGAPSTYPSQSEADTTQPAAALSFCAAPPPFWHPDEENAQADLRFLA